VLFIYVGGSGFCCWVVGWFGSGGCGCGGGGVGRVVGWLFGMWLLDLDVWYF